MNKKLLLLEPDSIPAYTGISGNMDINKMIPFIHMAQNNKVKPILGYKLYDKITKDFENDALVNKYEFIFNEFIIPMLSYWSAYYIVKMGSFSIDNAGTFQHESDDASALEYNEISRLAKSYGELATAVELRFQHYVGENKIPEIKGSGCNKKINPTNRFNWFLH